MRHLNSDDRVIVMADLSGVSHGRTTSESLAAYRSLKSSFNKIESDFEVGSPDQKMYAFCESRLHNLRAKMGAAAIRPISEGETESSPQRRKEMAKKKKSKENIKKRDEENDEALRKQSEKQKKSEHDPLAKAISSMSINQSQAAELLGVDKSTFSRWKNGTRNASAKNIAAVDDKISSTAADSLVDKAGDAD